MARQHVTAATLYRHKSAQAYRLAQAVLNEADADRLRQLGREYEDLARLVTRGEDPSVSRS